MPTPPPHRLRLLVVAVSFLAFARLIACDFTAWDDPETISHNPRLNPPSLTNLAYYWTTAGEHAPMGLYVPVTYTAWSALAAIAINPHLFHAANVAIHAATALLVFELLARLVPNTWAAALGALLFALHPVQVESVGWASGTKDLLCGFFAVAALLEYVNFTAACGLASVSSSFGDSNEKLLSRKRLHYALATICLVLAMLSKPTAIVVPLLAATIDYFLLHCPARQVLRALWPWFVMMIPIAIITQLSQPAPWSTPLPAWTRPAVGADAIAFYLYKLVLPLHHSVDYGRRPETIVTRGWICWTWLIPATIAVVLFICRRRRPFAVAAAMLFVIPLLPVLGLSPFMYQYASTVTDHYLYLAMLGPALLATHVIQRWPRCLPFAAIALLALAMRSIALEPVWQDTRSLFEHALAVNPDSFIACDMLGYDHFTRARAARGSYPATEQSELRAAATYYERGLAINPQFVPSMVNLAMVYQGLDRPDDARQQLRRIADLQPTLPPGLRADPLGLADTMIRFGDFADAVAWLDRVLQANPTNLQAARMHDFAASRLPTTATSGN